MPAVEQSSFNTKYSGDNLESQRAAQPEAPEIGPSKRTGNPARQPVRQPQGGRMKRRSFFQTAAAASTAVAISARADAAGSDIVKASHQAPRTGRPVEIDLEDPAAAAWMGEPSIDAFIYLEELFEGDPGQRSGSSLRLMEGRGAPFLNAEIAGTLQRDGTRGTHCLGYAQPEDVARFATAIAGGESPVEMPLKEMYPVISPTRPSGAKLSFLGGRHSEIRLYFGPHCLGVLPAALVAKFLECLHARTPAEAVCD
jgi:hypothetical protein